jgi:hypothetical protein
VQFLPPFFVAFLTLSPFLLGSALSNASALWSLIAVLISVILRRTFPGGVLARDYDTSGGKKEKKDKYRVHPAAGGNQNSSMVYPLCEVDGEGGDLEAGPNGQRRLKGGGGDVPEGCEMVGRDGNPVPPPSGQTAQGSLDSVAPNGAPLKGATAGAAGGKPHHEKDEEDGYCHMCLDECVAC